MGLLFPCLLWGGAAWLLLWVLLRFSSSVVLPSFPSFGWVSPSLQLGGAAWRHPSLGWVGCWVVGVLGGWVGCWGVGRFGRFGVSCWVVCLVVGFGVGVWLLGCWWLRGWAAFGVFSAWIGVGVFLKACFLVWARTTMKSTLKSDQHFELFDSVNHLKVERILRFRFLIFLKMLSCDEGNSEVWQAL